MGFISLIGWDLIYDETQTKFDSKFDLDLNPNHFGLYLIGGLHTEGLFSKFVAPLISFVMEKQIKKGGYGRQLMKGILIQF